MSRRKGFGPLTFALVAALAILVAFALYAPVKDQLTNMRVSGSITVAEAYWEVDSRKALQARGGTVVHAVVKLKSVSGYSGYIEVKVKRDLRLLPDTSVAFLKQYYTLEPGEEVEIKLAFKAASSIVARGYFIEVSWPGGKYVMEPRYPPRLTVISD